MPAFLAASWVADPYLGPVSLGLGKAARKKQGGGQGLVWQWNLGEPWGFRSIFFLRLKTVGKTWKIGGTERDFWFLHHPNGAHLF